MAIGPDIGWEEEGLAAIGNRRAPSQIIYSILEQFPARNFFPEAQRHGVGLLTRVPHASGLLDGTVKPGMSFDSTDHRSFRKQEWLENSLRKVARLAFLHGKESGRTIGQAAIQFALAAPMVASVLPNITNLEQLREFSAAPETAALRQEELDSIFDLYDHDFYLSVETAPSAGAG